jgi:flagellar basal body-associated protein FliL
LAPCIFIKPAPLQHHGWLDSLALNLAPKLNHGGKMFFWGCLFDTKTTSRDDETTSSSSTINIILLVVILVVILVVVVVVCCWATTTRRLVHHYHHSSSCCCSYCRPAAKKMVDLSDSEEEEQPCFPPDDGGGDDDDEQGGGDNNDGEDEQEIEEQRSVYAMNPTVLMDLKYYIDFKVFMTALQDPGEVDSSTKETRGIHFPKLKSVANKIFDKLKANKFPDLPKNKSRVAKEIVNALLKV